MNDKAGSRNEMKLNLLVLRCGNIDFSKKFYEGLGLDFIEEKHGTGPRHFSCNIGETVLELYPAGKRQTDGVRLGLGIANLEAATKNVKALGGEITSDHPLVIRDPDGHTIELSGILD